MKKFLLMLLVTAQFSGSLLYCAKLDISADSSFSLKTYSNLIDKNKNYDLTYINQNSSLNFTVKNIALEDTDNSFMDISLGLKFFSIDDSSKIINSAYISSINNFYDNKSSVFFPDKAYIKIYNFLFNDVVATFGRQPYTLSKGVVISDNGRGFDGIKVDILNKFYIDDISLFYFRPYQMFNGISKVYDNLFGLSLKKSFGDGVWNIYSVINTNSDITNDISFNAEKTNKQFYGISYVLDRNDISYFSELAFEKGSSDDITGKRIDNNGYAILTGANWKMTLPIFKKVNTRFTRLNSSGNPSNSGFTENKAFYSPYSKRYNGYERDGLGSIYSAGIFDVSKTSDTLNGMPDGLSGLCVNNLGVDFYYKGTFSIDFFDYKANKSMTLGPKILGSEIDLKYSFVFGKRAMFSITYATFNPNGLLKQGKSDLKSTNLFSVNIKASF